MTAVRALLGGRSRLIARKKRIDRAARRLIGLVGLLVVASVFAILVFTLGEAVPLFRPARIEAAGQVAAPRTGAGAFLVDEHREVVVVATADASLEAVDLLRQAQSHPSHRPTCFGAVGTGPAGPTFRRVEQGADVFVLARSAPTGSTIGVVRPVFTPRFDDGKRTGVNVSYEELFCGTVPGAVDDGAARLVRDGDAVRLAVVSGGSVALLEAPRGGAGEWTWLSGPASPPFAFVRLGTGDAAIAVARDGRMHHWTLAPNDAGTALAATLTDEIRATPATVSSVEWLLGSSTLLVGDDAGQVRAFFRTRLRETDESPQLVQTNAYAPLGGAVASLSPARRDRTFLALSANGDLRAFFGSSARELATTRVEVAGDAPAVRLAPRGDGFYVADGRGLSSYRFDNPHPEVSLQGLFGSLWYEGYPGPDAVWQSTGSTDDFEVKLSLLPLIFGTIKGTFYALLFAIPIAVTGALYTSQFAPPAVRGLVKPAVEIMAALPSVVIGFIAGLWLAPLADRHLVAVLLMIAATPFLGVFGFTLAPALRGRLPRALRDGGVEILVIPFVLMAGYAVLLAIAPAVEQAFFRGDARLWVTDALGLTYDQRNSLVVGIAMGFAVIPIIFTIAEDAFSSVPSNLAAASLALGASRWQTAIGVVLPTASPGIFSAIMVGFGRAVGETMIVLMATGNTPVFDWSIFNGMRTLSANIAVEIPEAPQGGTLYRTLFLAASLLFAMTFVVNTVAEIVRQRLRERYRAL